jgi:hypothetical protein
VSERSANSPLSRFVAEEVPDSVICTDLEADVSQLWESLRVPWSVAIKLSKHRMRKSDSGIGAAR